MINKIYNLNFSCSGEDENGLIFHSNCILDPIPYNPKQVTLYIKNYLKCSINCYHDNCKLNNKYLQICINIQKNIYTLLSSICKDDFKQIDTNLKNLFSNKSLKKEG